MIPNHINFIYFLNKPPFTLIHYLAIKSAYVVNNPEVINFYYEVEPDGEWWLKAKPYLNLIKVETPTHIFGVPIGHLAHASDLLRLQILVEKGGIYLDIDVICVKPFTPLLCYPFVLGEQGVEKDREVDIEGLCASVILSQKESFFLKKWIEGFYSNTSLWHGFRSNGHDKYWDEMSVKYPKYLAELFPDHICIQNYKKFFWPVYTPDHLQWFFRRNDASFPQAYCHHLWNNISWQPYLKDLTVEYIKNVDTNFTRIVRNFL